MGQRLNTTSKSSKETAAQKRARIAAEAAAGSVDNSSRRGESDDDGAPDPEPTNFDSGTLVPHQGETRSEPLVGPVQTLAERLAVEADPFSYVPAPADANDLDHAAHAARQITRADRGARENFGYLQRRYTMIVGRWLSEVAERKSYKAVGHKSVEKFAESLGIDRKEYYRFIEGFLVFDALGNMVEEPLGINTIEQLAITVRRNPEEARLQFAKMKEEGRVSAAGAKAVRKLLWGGEGKAIERAKPAPKELPPAIDRLQAAKAEGRIDLDLLKEVASNDPDSALAYIEEMRERLDAAEELVKK
ncbi:hypothetical protein [Streptomyces sp. NPDC054838]